MERLTTKSEILFFKKRRTSNNVQYAYATFIIRNDGFLPGALLYAYGLRLQQTKADIICFVSNGVSEKAIAALGCVYDFVIGIEEIFTDNINKKERNDLPYLFTRFHALRLGYDGDLGIHYKKVVMVDSDVLPICHYDHLFTLDTPAGILNERSDYLLHNDESGKYIVPDSVYENGTWRWHEVYDPICPHGKLIPAYITDRVSTDPVNMGVNACLYVLQPNIREFYQLLEKISEPLIQKTIREFRWPEMQYMTMVWSGKWHNIDPKFCGLKGYPDYRVLYGIHYAGHKPWLIEEQKPLLRMLKFPDYVLWCKYYISMIKSHPDLLAVKRLKRLYSVLDIPQVREKIVKIINKKI